MSAVLTEPKTTAATANEEGQLKYEVSVEGNFASAPGELPYRFCYRHMGETEWKPLSEMDIVVKGGVSLAVFYLVAHEEGLPVPNFTTYPIQWVKPVEGTEEYQPIDSPGSFQVSRNDNRTCTLTITNTTIEEECNEFFLCVTYQTWLAGAHPTVTTLPDTTP